MLPFLSWARSMSTFSCCGPSEIESTAWLAALITSESRFHVRTMSAPLRSTRSESGEASCEVGTPAPRCRIAEEKKKPTNKTTGTSTPSAIHISLDDRAFAGRSSVAGVGSAAGAEALAATGGVATGGVTTGGATTGGVTTGGATTGAAATGSGTGFDSGAGAGILATGTGGAAGSGASGAGCCTTGGSGTSGGVSRRLAIGTICARITGRGLDGAAVKLRGPATAPSYIDSVL